MDKISKQFILISCLNVQYIHRFELVENFLLKTSHYSFMKINIMQIITFVILISE